MSTGRAFIVAWLFAVNWTVAFAPVPLRDAAAAREQREPLPTRFDSPFEPQHIDPNLAVIAPTTGFEQGRYDIRMTLSETTLYDPSRRFTRNYAGDFVLQALKLPTDDFEQLAGKSFAEMTDDSSWSFIEFRQVRGEPGQEPYAQQYPVAIKSLRFGPSRRHVVYLEIFFVVDFGAVGPPTPWSKRAAISPYQLAVMGSNPGYPPEAWESFRRLVQETRLAWSKARYETNVRVLLNHEYQSSSGMNTHER